MHIRPASKARVSAGTGVALAWWKSLHRGAWLLLLAVLVTLAWCARH